MASTRIVLGMSFASAGLALVLACSGTSTGTTGGDGGTSGGTSGASGGTSGSSGSAVKNCSTGSTTSKCSAAEIQPYTDCIQSKCDSVYSMCYGAGYKTGSFSGPCGTYITCSNACDCTDTACRSKCTLDPTCTSCISMFSSCSEGCTIPACATSGGTSGTSGGTSGASGGTSGTSGTTGKTCADFAACCAAKTGTAQTQCNQAYDAIKANGDATCNAAYSSYCP